MSSINIKTGSEGPRHDPYHYDEITVNRPDGSWVTLHVGLAFWAETSEGERIDNDDRGALVLFEKAAGISLPVAYKAYREVRVRRYTRHPCGQKHFIDVQGFPGESFVFCRKCGDAVDSFFNSKAVE